MNENKRIGNPIVSILFILSIALYWFRPLPPSDYNELVYTISGVFFWVYASFLGFILFFMIVAAIAAAIVAIEKLRK